MGGTAALGPVVGALQRLDVVIIVQRFRALIEAQNDVRPQFLLDVNDLLRGKEVLGAVQVGAEGHARRVHSPQVGQAEDLEAA